MSHSAQIRALMPGLSDRQYELRAKLLAARDYAAQSAGNSGACHEVWQLGQLLGSMVNQAVMREISDERLEKVVEYCRTLARAIGQAELVFAFGAVENDKKTG